LVPESGALKARIVLAGGLASVALLGAAGFYAARDAAPACDSEPALHAVTDILRDRFQLDGIFLNNIGTVSGGFFGGRRECSAEVASIRGNVNASDMTWRSIQYQIDQPGKSERPIFSVQLGGDVPLAKQTPSFWERLLAHL
jgi:hypothetical protein